jgi:hypothetical protein
MPKKKHDIRSSRVELRGEGITGVVLVGAMFHCTNCEALMPADQFGLRFMGDGTVRNQAQCASCRGARPRVPK